MTKVKIWRLEVKHSLLPAVCDFTFLCYLYFWGDVLEEVDLAQQYLHTLAVNLDKVVTKLEALNIFLHEERDQLCEIELLSEIPRLRRYLKAAEINLNKCIN